MTRQLFTLVVLWALVLFFCFALAGHVFEIIALVPNWRSGTPDDVARLRDFYSHSGPGTYFLFVLTPTLFTSLLAIAMTWKSRWAVRTLSVVPLLVLVIYAVWTQMYFVPINMYIGRQDYDAPALKAMVDGWVFWERPRAGLLALGLVAAITLIERYRGQLDHDA